MRDQCHYWVWSSRVQADRESLTCKPAKVVTLAQRYFAF